MESWPDPWYQSAVTPCGIYHTSLAASDSIAHSFRQQQPTSCQMELLRGSSMQLHLPAPCSRSSAWPAHWWQCHRQQNRCRCRCQRQKLPPRLLCTGKPPCSGHSAALQPLCLNLQVHARVRGSCCTDCSQLHRTLASLETELLATPAAQALALSAAAPFTAKISPTHSCSIFRHLQKESYGNCSC